MEIQRLVDRPLAIPVPNAYLVEAIEETSLAFAEEPGVRSLYVFSDMLQHSSWFSHAELGSQRWGFNDFIHVREMEEASVGPRPPPLDDVSVRVYYVPRQGVTDAPRPKMNHMAFWRQYFTDALGAEPTFAELAALPDYPVEPLLNTLTEAEQLVQERRRLEAESKRLERATAEYEAAQRRARAEQARRAKEAEEEAARQAAEEAARLAAAAEAERVAAQEAAEQEVAEDQPSDEAPPRAIAQAEDPPAAAQEPPAASVEPLAAAAGPAGEVAPGLAAAEPEPPPNPAPTLPEPPAPPPPAQPETSYCTATLRERFQNSNAYPIQNRRLNLGAADIAVEFVVDDEGETVDDSVLVIEQSSTATRPSYFDAFADEAVKVVREWVFDFDAAADACTRTQTVRARVKFTY